MFFNLCKQSGGQTIAAFPEYLGPILIPSADSDVVDLVSNLVLVCESGDLSLISYLDEIFDELVFKNNTVNSTILQNAKESLKGKLAS